VKETIMCAGNDSLKPFPSQIETIPRLTHTEEVELAWRVRAGDEEAKQRFILANLRLVVAVARGYSTVELELADHIQNGYFGLLRAVEHFDPTRKVHFGTYAMFWIRQAIGRGAQMSARLIHLPVYIQEQQGRLSRVSDAWFQEHGTEASVEVLAQSLGVEVEHVRLLQASWQGAISMDRTCEWEEEESPSFADGLVDPDAELAFVQIDDACASEQMSATLARALTCLTKREQTVVKLYYGLGRDAVPSHAKIGRMIGVSRARVQQILDHALSKLRQAYGDEGVALEMREVVACSR
jgi:RNA polymerase primary sigma factor